MWIFSKLGFYSIVKKDGIFMVRARKRQDLLNLINETKINTDVIVTRWADYRFRIILKKKDVEKVFATLCATIDYGNFKSMMSATPDQSDKMPKLHYVWETMYDYQETHEVK